MEWVQAFTQGRQPTPRETEEFISSPFWGELNEFLQQSYGVSPSYSYSTCSGQPGWNVKYQKAGRSLCTLYPMAGYFIALVVIGGKEQLEAETLLPTCTEHVQKLFAGEYHPSMGRWLMINVTSPEVLEDVKRLIQTRRKIK